MQECGLEPNTITYNAAISACGQGGQWERALPLLEGMKERGLEPDIITYSAAISACGKDGQWERALALLEEMKKRGLEPNNITYSAIIEALPVSELDKTRDVLRKAIAKGYFQVWKTPRIFDLHMKSDVNSATASVANALLYHTLCEYAEGSRQIQGDLEVVTGRGRGSGKNGPVLPTSTRTFLTKVIDPPLEVRDNPINPGCFTVTATSLKEWVASRESNSTIDNGIFHDEI